MTERTIKKKKEKRKNFENILAESTSWSSMDCMLRRHYGIGSLSQWLNQNRIHNDAVEFNTVLWCVYSVAFAFSSPTIHSFHTIVIWILWLYFGGGAAQLIFKIEIKIKLCTIKMFRIENNNENCIAHFAQ